MVAAKSRLPCNGKPSSYELMKRENAKEASLRTLMIAGLNDEAAAYRALLSGLSGHLRAYYRGKLVRAGRGTEETEDSVQEALMAVHMRRHTYDPTQPNPAPSALSAIMVKMARNMGRLRLCEG